MQYPVIKVFETTQTFHYLWLKYVDGFDLSKHCARCLLGKYSARVDETKVSLYNVPLDEANPKYYYLCGVTYPYKWNDNLHLAFRYKPGATIEFQDKGTRIVIQDAERIYIYRMRHYNIEHGDDPAYCTCRNWRFAYQMTYLEQ